MKILIVEDQDEKAKDIVNFVKELYGDVAYEVRCSLKSGLKEITQVRDYDLAILDMSMPSFDPSIDDPLGGKPESFAGKKLLEHMTMRNINIPSVVLSQYPQFNDGTITLEGLSSELNKKHSLIFLGAVYYTSAAGRWKSDLIKILKDNGFVKNA